IWRVSDLQYLSLQQYPGVQADRGHPTQRDTAVSGVESCAKRMAVKCRVLTGDPSEPGDPFSPLGPGAPAAPDSPGRPAGPVSPRDPRGPASPFGPVSPLSPLAPG
uniref:Uncharacterized protein n=1 Tax=Xiphophorus couchianus TaxID=32473 RepID=A0A3B5L447_9TELE